jgi:DNA-binding CsgD family transcriptional regulator
MKLRKGTSIINMRTFVAERFGPRAWDELLTPMSEADRAVLSSIVPEGWYDMTLHARLNRLFCDFFYDGNLAGVEELGRFSAEQDLARGGRWIFTILRPSVVLRHFENYWRQEEGSGSWTCHARDHQFIAQLSGWEGGDHVLCRRLVGYLGRMLETTGAVTSREHVHAVCGDATNCTFRFGWQLERDSPSGERIASKEKLWEAARELDLFSDVASFADVITELVHVQLSCPYVALRARFADHQSLTLVRDAGSRGEGTAICYMLQRSGRFIGQLDVEVGSDSRQDLLDELVPLLALPLDATRLSELQVSSEGGFARRLLSARAKWRLTARETDVLELLIRGRSYKEIAGELGCEQSTVEQHVVHVLRKSGTKSRSALSWCFWTEL